MILLKRGMSGPKVRDLQVMLNLQVPSLPLLEVDGIFGPKTYARVVMFQNQAGLVPDGIVGPFTTKALVGTVLTALNSGPGPVFG
jgi:peptidoglycan hydrolase-like protein with peptidoglycan-binding domain